MRFAAPTPNVTANAPNRPAYRAQPDPELTERHATANTMPIQGLLRAIFTHFIHPLRPKVESTNPEPQRQEELYS